MKKFFLFMCWLWPFCLLAQLHDNTWVMGYPGPPPRFGTSIFTFDDGALSVKANDVSPIDFEDNNAAISTAEGQLIAYFNGFFVADKTFRMMSNGQNLAKEVVEWLYYLSDDDLPQGSLFLPWPGRPDSVLLLYQSQAVLEQPGGGGEFGSVDLSLAIINTKANNGRGIVQRAINVLHDTIQYGRLTAAKHANGRDWWVLAFERNTNLVYRFLADKEGVHLVGIQYTQQALNDGLGQAAFSPDGTKYAMFNGVSAVLGSYLDIYDFDRCEGTLSKQVQYKLAGEVGGLAISANSRYLYHGLGDTVFQYDLAASDIWSSRKIVALYDGFADPFPVKFYLSQLAPDRRIYITATNSTQHMHLIEKPNQAGSGCRFNQHGLKLPRLYYASVPNFPNFRLGPLDGSPCDTLGLNNVPVAWYRYEQDTLDPLAVAFTDLSYYEPAEWYWDFGDGSLLSRDTSPAHIFPDKGQYKVCLTVRNQYGTHTHCKTLYLGVSAQDNPVLQAQIQVSPNPFSERLAVALSAPELRGAAFRLFDATGRLVREMGLEYGINEVEAGELAKGLYFWAVEKKGERVKSGKIVKM